MCHVLAEQGKKLKFSSLCETGMLVMLLMLVLLHSAQ